MVSARVTLFELIRSAHYFKCIKSMKFPILLGALLLSTASAVADDFVYLECHYELKMESRAIRSNQLVMSDVEKISQYLKVDLKNNRLMTSDTEKWRDVLTKKSTMKATNTLLKVNFQSQSNLLECIAGKHFLEMMSLGMSCVPVELAKKLMLQYLRRL